MDLPGLVDWRGHPVINKKRHGGVKASMFIHVLIVMANISNVPLILNLVSYLHGTMHMGVKDASTTSTNFFGAICFFSFLGAFLSDSYVMRFYTIIAFAPIEIMGYLLLACQAHIPSLHPPPCDMVSNHPNECPAVSGRNLSLLTLGLYLIPVGEGSVRACAAALGGDQFDGEDPAELHAKISFFNWFAFSISLGGFVGLVFLVRVQDNEGWGLSFALAAIMVFVGMVVVSCGLPFYRHRRPMGSPLTRIFQVFIAAFRKRKLSLPENLMEMHDGTGTRVEFMERTPDFRFLDKAAVDDGDKRAWSLCTVTQVEEAKIILRMLPIFLSSVLGNVPIPLLLALTVQQGATMDTRLGGNGTRIPPASLFIVPIVFQMLILVAYDRAFVPWLRRATGYAGGVTHLQRVAVGFVSSVMALATAAVVEGRRRRRRSVAAPPMSVFWLTPQFFLLGLMDVTSFVGLLEFFYSEASAGTKSIGGAIVFCILGASSWLGSLLIQVVNHATAGRHGGSHGWLDGASLNASRLDLFYWLLTTFALVSLFLYLLCAWRYAYRHDPKKQLQGVAACSLNMS